MTVDTLCLSPRYKSTSIKGEFNSVCSSRPTEDIFKVAVDIFKKCTLKLKVLGHIALIDVTVTIIIGPDTHSNIHR